MKTILVTGSNGFMGKNLMEGLKRQENLKIKAFDIEDDMATLRSHLKEADFIFHLAGVNRPQELEEFEIGNVDFTKTIVKILEEFNKPIPLVFASSIQAEIENPYGLSKKKAEAILIEYSRKTFAKIYIYRFPNVFGKWSRPNYNSAVATFCHNISRGLDITISDAHKEIELVYIDDIVNEFLILISEDSPDIGKKYYAAERTYKVTLGELVNKIYLLRDIRQTSILPDFSDDFMKCLYATYLSFLDKKDFSIKLEAKKDQRGSLVEILKSNHFGQIFVSTSRKGVIRGNHYHNTKIEKFCVLKGKAVIKLRNILESEILTYAVSGEEVEVIDIPPGYTHSIENLSEEELVVLFWANQIYDPQNPDTHFKQV